MILKDYMIIWSRINQSKIYYIHILYENYRNRPNARNTGPWLDDNQSLVLNNEFWFSLSLSELEEGEHEESDPEEISEEELKR